MVSELFDSQGHKTMKTLSCQEVYERMDNRLCLFCEELDSPGHYHLKHKRVQIFMTVSEDDDLSDDNKLDSVDLKQGEDHAKPIAEENLNTPLGQNIEHLEGKLVQTVSAQSTSHDLNPDARLHGSSPASPIILKMSSVSPQPPDPPDRNRSNMIYAIKAEPGSESDKENDDPNHDYGDGFMQETILLEEDVVNMQLGTEEESAVGEKLLLEAYDGLATQVTDNVAGKVNVVTDDDTVFTGDNINLYDHVDSALMSNLRKKLIIYDVVFYRDVETPQELYTVTELKCADQMFDTISHLKDLLQTRKRKHDWSRSRRFKFKRKLEAHKLTVITILLLNNGVVIPVTSSKIIFLPLDEDNQMLQDGMAENDKVLLENFGSVDSHYKACLLVELACIEFVGGKTHGDEMLVARWKVMTDLDFCLEYHRKVHMRDKLGSKKKQRCGKFWHFKYKGRDKEKVDTNYSILLREQREITEDGRVNIKLRSPVCSDALRLAVGMSVHNRKLGVEIEHPVTQKHILYHTIQKPLMQRQVQMEIRKLIITSVTKESCKKAYGLDLTVPKTMFSHDAYLLWLYSGIISTDYATVAILETCLMEIIKLLSSLIKDSQVDNVIMRYSVLFSSGFEWKRSIEWVEIYFSKNQCQENTRPKGAATMKQENQWAHHNFENQKIVTVSHYLEVQKFPWFKELGMEYELYTEALWSEFKRLLWKGNRMPAEVIKDELWSASIAQYMGFAICSRGLNLGINQCVFTFSHFGLWLSSFKGHTDHGGLTNAAAITRYSKHTGLVQKDTKKNWKLLLHDDGREIDSLDAALIFLKILLPKLVVFGHNRTKIYVQAEFSTNVVQKNELQRETVNDAGGKRLMDIEDDIINKPSTMLKVSHFQDVEYGTTGHKLLSGRERSRKGTEENSWTFMWIILKEVSETEFEKETKTTTKHLQGLSKHKKNHNLLSLYSGVSIQVTAINQELILKNCEEVKSCWVESCWVPQHMRLKLSSDGDIMRFRAVGFYSTSFFSRTLMVRCQNIAVTKVFVYWKVHPPDQGTGESASEHFNPSSLRTRMLSTKEYCDRKSAII